ncbi:DUF192 domain-containing protein [Candidatus Peregrinibacteria bacterium]|nr:DUF192 domain-containing protein [Candidatus Peregrinibacteria bacterium]
MKNTLSTANAKIRLRTFHFFFQYVKWMIFGIFFIFIVLFFIFFVFGYCRYGSFDGNRGEVVIQTPVTEFLISAEVADTSEKRAKGLMYRENLPDEMGMLFIFEEAGIRNFWMKNTLIPLDIIFLSSDKKIVGISNNVQPCSDDFCPYISSEEPAQYVLEVRGGFAAENSIEVGDTVQFTYPFARKWLSCGSRYLR